MREIRVRVVGQEKGFYRISNGDAERLGKLSGKFLYQVQSVLDYPAVGDYVTATWPDDGNDCIIELLFPRKSAFVRRSPGNGNEEQVIAANMDVVFICMSMNRDLNMRRLERYLSAVWDSGAVPVVVLTKSDLCENKDLMVEDVKKSAMGVDVIPISSFEDEIEEVKAYLKEGTTIAMIGSSGVGKSTLINRLLGRDVLATSEIRKDDRGRHTTTHREILKLPGGAYVIDTPGMRELGMWENEKGIETAFDDIEEIVKRCRFSDCSHQKEPGCAVKEALQSGELSEERWRSYQKLMAENAYTESREDYLEEKRNKFKEISNVNKGRRK